MANNYDYVWIPTYCDPNDKNIMLPNVYGGVFRTCEDCHKWIDKNTAHPENFIAWQIAIH